MTREVLFTLSSGFRENFELIGYRFGKGEKAACIVGALRGNEYEHLYCASQLIDILSRLEERGALVADKEILVIPCAINTSMNVGKRNWVRDNQDINRHFPGNEKGEAPDRVAAAVMKAVEGYSYGIQYTGFYLAGEFVPHVRTLGNSIDSTSLASLFGLPYVVTGQPRSFDTRTLNYNWHERGTSSFSLYISSYDYLNEEVANQAVSATLRFLTRMGIIKYNCHNGHIASILAEEDLVTVKPNISGFFRRTCQINKEVRRGDILAEVLDPYEGNIIDRIVAPVDGILFFAQTSPILFEHSVAFRIIKKLHL